MFEKKDSGHNIDILFALSLFLLFAFLSLILIVLGADLYRKTVAQMNENYNTRIVSSYLAEKFRQGDQLDSIDIEDFHGTQALVLTHTLGDDLYASYIYHYQGTLRELRSKKGASVGDDPLAGGTVIASLDAMEICRLHESLYAVTLTQNRESRTIYLSLHSR